MSSPPTNNSQPAKPRQRQRKQIQPQIRQQWQQQQQIRQQQTVNKYNKFKLPDQVDPVDIGIKILTEEDEDGVPTRCLTELKQRYYSNFASAQELLEQQETPVVQIHFTYMQPLATMAQDIFISATINHMELDVEWDITEANQFVIGFCFITPDDKLWLISKDKTARIFAAKPDDRDLQEIREQLLSLEWTPVLATSPVLEDDPQIVITKDQLSTILDKRNGAIRLTTVQAPVDLSGLLTEYMNAATLFHVSKIDKERHINTVLQQGQAQVIDHTNTDGGWALVHQDCIGLPKWDIKPYPKQAEWDEIERRYKELRNKLRVAQIRQLDLLKYANGSLFNEITPSHKYHVIFTGVLYNDPAPNTLKNLAIEHVKFIQTILAQPNMGIGITNIDVSVSRLYDRLSYDKMDKTDYYVQNPVVYGWHSWLSRVSKVHGLDLVSINSSLTYNPESNEKKPSGAININRCVRTTIFIVWFN